MSKRSPSPDKGTAFQKARDILAYTASVAVAFFATGPTYTATISGVRDFVASAYAPELTGLASLGWFAIVALLVFALSTLAVFSAVQVAGAWFARLSLILK